VPVAELIRKTGITEQTYYRWKAKYAVLDSGTVGTFVGTLDRKWHISASIQPRPKKHLSD
jgi:hypothetical protein